MSPVKNCSIKFLASLWLIDTWLNVVSSRMTTEFSVIVTTSTMTPPLMKIVPGVTSWTLHKTSLSGQIASWQFCNYKLPNTASFSARTLQYRTLIFNNLATQSYKKSIPGLPTNSLYQLSETIPIPAITSTRFTTSPQCMLTGCPPLFGALFWIPIPNVVPTNCVQNGC